MKLCRFTYGNRQYCGVVEGETVYAVKGDDIFGGSEKTGESFPVGEVVFLCPTIPKNIFAVGLNYKKHAAEMGMELPTEPLIFLKATSSLNGHNAPIIKPAQSKEISCEAELAIIVSRDCKDIDEQEAEKYILGYSLINDVTARDIQRQESQWMRAKSFDGFCPYGPVVETDIDAVGPCIRLYINDKQVQAEKLSDMVFPPKRILSYVSKQFTLHRGDIIATGTPDGVPTVQAGETATVEVDNLGVLKNIIIEGEEND